jgi:hypothetical protein
MSIWPSERRTQPDGGVAIPDDICVCGKRSYPSAHNAKMANRHVRFRFRVYRCPRGGGWHITNSEKHA